MNGIAAGVLRTAVVTCSNLSQVIRIVRIQGGMYQRSRPFISLINKLRMKGFTMIDEKAIAKAFEVVGGKMKDFESDMAEIKRYADQMTRQMKIYGKAMMSGTMNGEDYDGFWPNEEMAKAFGVIVMKAVGKEVKDMGVGDVSQAGGLVPDELASFIIQKLGKYGKFRKNALVVKIASGKQFVPRVTTDLVIYCPGEGKQITKSDVKVDMVGLIAKKFACVTVINAELEEDSIIGLGEIVGASIVRSMAKKEDLIGFIGDGTETYFGMIGIVGALLKVDETIGNIKGLQVASGNAYSEINLADLRKVVGILPDDADEDAKWYMNKKFYYEVVYPLAETAGNANVFEILTDRKGRFLLGYPVEFVSAMPSTEANSQICAILGDLSIGAYIGERKELTIDQSKEAFFLTDQLGIRGIERIDINAYGVGDTTEAGPIVALITAAS